MNKKLELELVNLHIQDIKDQIQLLETKLVELQNRRIELEKEIFEEENQTNKSIDNLQVDSEEETNRNQINYGGNKEIGEPLETFQDTNINLNQINSSSSDNIQTSTLNTKTYKCNLCSKTFPKEYYLTKHSRIHNRNKLSIKTLPRNSENDTKNSSIDTPDQLLETNDNSTHKCSQCGKKFSQKSCEILRDWSLDE